MENKIHEIYLIIKTSILELEKRPTISEFIEKLQQSKLEQNELPNHEVYDGDLFIGLMEKLVASCLDQAN